MLEHSSKEVFPLVRDTIDEILNAIDVHCHNPTHLLQFLRVLFCITTSVQKWFSSGEALQSNSSQDNKSSENIDDDISYMISEIVDFEKNLHITEDFSNHNEDNSDLLQGNEDNQEATDDTPPPPPDHIITIERIIQRCKNLMINTDFKVRILALDILRNAIPILSTHENTFLPLVHQAWPPLMDRTKDTELQVKEAG